MKKFFGKFALISFGTLAGLFAVYYYNLDMKLMRFVVLPILDKHHDNMKRDHFI